MSAFIFYSQLAANSGLCLLCALEKFKPSCSRLPEDEQIHYDFELNTWMVLPLIGLCVLILTMEHEKKLKKLTERNRILITKTVLIGICLYICLLFSCNWIDRSPCYDSVSYYTRFALATFLFLLAVAHIWRLFHNNSGKEDMKQFQLLVSQSMV